MSQSTTPRLIPVAMGAAGLGVAAHVVGKAARDALFVSSFPIKALPYAFLGTGIASGFAIAIYTRVTARRSPRQTAPMLALFVSVSLVVAWFLARKQSLAVTAILYGWLTLTGSLVVSSFWALLSELLDVRAARRSLGVLTLASSIGGLAGAVLTHVFLVFAGPTFLLLPLAFLNAALVFFLWAMTTLSPERRAASSSPVRSARGGLGEGVRAIAKETYLRDIAVLVATMAIAGTFADFLLKSNAAASIHDADALARFFATFHGVVGAVTLGIQLLFARPLLKKRGLAATLVVLPGFLLAGAVGFVALPSMIAAVGLRGGENATRNSFYRAAYELLFIPVRPETKRGTKPILDTLLERLADGLGALVLIALVSVGAGAVLAQRASVALIAVLSLIAAYFVLRVRRGYVKSLESNLVEYGEALKDLGVAVESDRTARETVAMTLRGDGMAHLRQRFASTPVGRTMLEALEEKAPGGTLRAVRESEVGDDPVLDLVRRLGQSTDAATLENAIAAWDGKDRRVLPFVVELLTRDGLFVAAFEALKANVDRHIGALSDELADIERPFAIRRRIPRVLAHASSKDAPAALYRVLQDERFEVRYQAALALRQLAKKGLPIDKDVIWSAVRHDVKRALPLWEAERLIDEGLEDAQSMREIVARKGAFGLRHVFNLLALVLEPEPADLAFRSLDSDDPHVRAVALEYLENVLPPDVRLGLWPTIGDAPASSVAEGLVSKRAVNEILAELRSASR